MKTKILIATILVTLFTVGCTEEEETLKDSVVYVNVKFPKNFRDKNPKIESAVFELENVNTGEKIVREVDYFPVSYFNVEDGLYNISVKGKMKYEAETSEGELLPKTVDVRALEENILIQGGNFDSPMEFFLYDSSSTFVISEIFFAGTQTPEGIGKQYQGGDQFIELYNNSKDTLYADGLCIAETQLLTVQKHEKYTPDIRSEMVPVCAVYRIPGKGKDYPVMPGETIVIVDVAINHKENNSNSLDLSKADFEWFDDNEEYPDTNVPEVTNMEKFVSTSATVWGPHKKGYKGYLLFRPDIDLTAEQFAKDYAYHYSYLFVFGDFKIDMQQDAWKVPNKWVIDAVQCSLPSEYQWATMASSLDISWTYAKGEYRLAYGHSVKRKIANKEKDERIVLQDTNDSATDFISTAPNPSPGAVEDHKEQE